MVWPARCVPVRGRDSLVPVLPDRGSVFGFSGFMLAHVCFGIPRLACCCLPLEDCGRVVRSGSSPLITPRANLFQPWPDSHHSRFAFLLFIFFPDIHLDLFLCVCFILFNFFYQRSTSICSTSPSPSSLRVGRPHWITVIKKKKWKKPAALRPPLLHRQIW